MTQVIDQNFQQHVQPFNADLNNFNKLVLYTLCPIDILKVIEPLLYFIF